MRQPRRQRTAAARTHKAQRAGGRRWPRTARRRGAARQSPVLRGVAAPPAARRRRPAGRRAPVVRHARRGVVRRSSAGRHQVELAQDDALAQRPGADLQLLHPEEVHRAPPRPARPASSCPARPSETPGSAARCSALIAGEPRHPLLQRRRGAAPAARTGPRRCGPRRAILASCRKVLDVPTAWSGGPRRRELRDRPGDLARARACAAPARRPAVGGSPGSHAPVSRPAPSGSDTAASGYSSIP